MAMDLGIEEFTSWDGLGFFNPSELCLWNGMGQIVGYGDAAPPPQLDSHLQIANNPARRGTCPPATEPSASSSPPPSTYHHSDLTQTPGLRFACPYFQRQPHLGLHGYRRSCSGPGFTDIPKLNLCSQGTPLAMSPSKAEPLLQVPTAVQGPATLKHHMRSRKVCPVVNVADKQKMLDQDQVHTLRKRSDRNVSPEDKWVKIYRIVHRLDDLSPVPSPYHDSKPPRPSETDSPDSMFIDTASIKRYVSQPAVRSAITRDIHLSLPQSNDRTAIADTITLRILEMVPRLFTGWRDEQLKHSGQPTPSYRSDDPFNDTTNGVHHADYSQGLCSPSLDSFLLSDALNPWMGLDGTSYFPPMNDSDCAP